MTGLLQVLVDGLVVLVAGYTGARLGARRRSEEGGAPAAPSGPVCSCGHGYGSHSDGKRCGAEVARPHYSPIGTRNGHEWVACPCRAYDGPPPLNIIGGWSA